MPKVHPLGHVPIADHSFAPDHSLLALARDNSVELYASGGSKYKLLTSLVDHKQMVTSVDISETGRIVTCSQDRNALVWEPIDETGKNWKQTLVLLRINRAATFVRWSPDGKKFAVGSGARVIAICYFEDENDWWVSKHIKKSIKSTILSVRWHPNSVLLAAGSTDGHARVFSAYVKGLDSKPPASVWGERLPFQTLCGDYLNNTGAWIHDVEFSPSGDLLAFTGHDASITIVYPSSQGGPPKAVISISSSFLPFKSLSWINESEIVVAGHDCHPVVFNGDESGWQYSKSIDGPENSKVQHNNSNYDDDDDDLRERNALNMFRQMDLKGKVSLNSATGNNAEDLPTIHQNTINTIRPYDYDQNGNVIKISSTGLDGRVVIFDI